MNVNALAPAFFKLDAAAALLKSASVGDRTQRDDPRVHEAQELTTEAIMLAAALGIPEVELYRLANIRRS